jgi:hypothetical protein
MLRRLCCVDQLPAAGGACYILAVIVFQAVEAERHHNIIIMV